MNALAALALGVPVTVLVPLFHWLYGGQGAAAVVLLGAVPAYVFGRWLKRRATHARALWCFACAVLPLVLALWSIATRAGEATGWFWLAAAVVTGGSALSGSRGSRNHG